MATSSWFDASYYLKEKAEQLNETNGTTTWNAASVLDALQDAGFAPEDHYSLYGWQEGLSPNPYYNEGQYVSEKVKYLNGVGYEGKTDWTADSFKASCGGNPFQDYLQSGAYEESVNPSSGFDDDAYYQAKAKNLNQTSAFGRTDWTAADVKTEFQNEGLTPIGHYLLYGRYEGFYAPEASLDAVSLNAYMCADNNLSDAGVADVNEMESAKLSGDIVVTYQLDTSSEYASGGGGTVHGIISQNADQSQSSITDAMPEQNMGLVGTLENYINWSDTITNADVETLILWDHGGGISGCCWDDGSGGSNLSVQDIATAIQNSGDGHVDVVAFDACLMGILDQAYALSGYTDVMVASEDDVPENGYDYTGLLNNISSNTVTTAEGVGEAMVTTYDASYDETVTLSALDMSKLDKLITALRDFDTTWDASGQSKYILLRAEHEAQRYDDNVDLVDFMQKIAEASSSSKVDAAAQAVIDATDDVVIAACGGSDAHGLTVYMPLQGDSSYLTTTGASLLAATGWSDIYSTIWSA